MRALSSSQLATSRAATAHLYESVSPMAVVVFVLVAVCIVFGWMFVGATIHPALGISAAAITVWVLWGWKPVYAVGLLLVLSTFQNLGIAIASGSIADPAFFRVLQGTNFAVLSICGVRALADEILSWKACSEAERRLILGMSGALGLVLLYSVIGLRATSATSVAIYFRYTVTGLLSLIVGVAVSRTATLRELCAFAICVGACSAVLLVPEVFASRSYFRAIGAPEYFTLKYGVAYNENDVLSAVTRRFFNLPIYTDAVSRRFLSSVMHQVSYGYILLSAAVAALAMKRSVPATVFAVLVLLAGVKGPAIALVAVMGLIAWSSTVRTGTSALLLMVLAGYIVGGSVVGLLLRDQHAVGFLAGLESILDAPLGHGIGVGGNLSDAVRDVGGANWDVWRSAGAPFALESAIGVLMYQMGLLSLPVVAIYLWCSVSVLRKFGFRSAEGVVVVAFCMVLANGIFQEEAFAPYAIGTMSLLLGAAFGHLSGVTSPREAGAAAVGVG